MERRTSIPFILIIMGMIESYIYLVYHYSSEKGDLDTDTSGIVAICVALISVAGGIWAQVVQFKKDSGTMNSIRTDTSEMKPTVNNIDKNVEKVRDEVVEKIVPEMSRLDGIDLLVDDYRYRQRIKAENSLILNENQLKGSIESIFERNAALTQELQKVTEENTMLKLRNKSLEYDNDRLKEQLRTYQGDETF